MSGEGGATVYQFPNLDAIQPGTAARIRAALAAELTALAAERARKALAEYDARGETGAGYPEMAGLLSEVLRNLLESM